MEPFERVRAHCEIRNAKVEILMVTLRKGKTAGASRTPIRCQSSADCPRSAFCRFVNPLTTRLPARFEEETPVPAEAS